MTHPFYDFAVSEKAVRFDFVSVGVKIIPKVIIFDFIYEPNIFNLVLADILPNGEIDIKTISDNGDRNKILATVAQAIVLFFDAHPDAWVLFTGSTPARTRLYRIAIHLELHTVVNQFNVYGISNGQLERFQPNRPYDRFAFSKKKA
ncbi:hypothetical protein GCM10028819_26880 [Spirosoma humi]